MAGKETKKKKENRYYFRGIHVNSTFNNTIITI